MTSPFRWLVSNLSGLLLSFALAVVVWVTAVTAADPNVDRVRILPIEIVGRDPEMLLVGSVPTQARIAFRAPRSVADRLSSTDNAMRAWVDVSGQGAGTSTLVVQAFVSPTYTPVRIVQISPETATLTLEPLTVRNFTVALDVNGEPAGGYQKGVPARNPSVVTISGPESLVSIVEEVRAALDITNASETIEAEILLQAYDANGRIVPDITISPSEVAVTQPITLQGGYRNVVVRVVTTGEVAPGYRLTNITVSPPNVVVFSTNPQLVADLPSFIETDPVDLSGATDDVDKIVALVLPQGISVVGVENVLVQVSIAVQEERLRLSVPVEIDGLAPIYAAIVIPERVDVILVGPVPALNLLNSADIRLSIAVDALGLGVHNLELQASGVPERIRLESLLPSTVVVTIFEAPTPTPTNTVVPLSIATPTP